MVVKARLVDVDMTVTMIRCNLHMPKNMFCTCTVIYLTDMDIYFKKDNLRVLVAQHVESRCYSDTRSTPGMKKHQDGD